MPTTMEIFNAHSEDVRVAIWQAMTKCGYVDYLKAYAAILIDGEWDMLVNIGLYFSRNPLQNGAHKDTEGENLFVMLFYCNDQHKALAMKATTEDPFDGTALIDIPHLGYSAKMTVPRGKELRREMSEKLENGTVPPQPRTRDMARVWVMARRKPT